MQNYYIRIEDMPSLVSHQLSIIKYVVLKKIFFFPCFGRLIWTWTWTWTRTSLDSDLTLEKITCLNDWRPVALTPIFSKCFEKLIRDHICSVRPASLDPLQFAYRSNRSTDDVIAFTLHTALSHLENKTTYVRILFVDYSSAFNTIVLATLVAKLQTLGLNRSLCS